SIRLTLCWKTAVILPTNRVAAAINATKICQVCCALPKASSNSRIKPTKIDTFTIVAMKEVNTVGAPSYTSGVQKWNGAAETLKAIDTSRSNSPAIKTGATCGRWFQISSIKKVPVVLAPYKNAIPSNISPVENDPIRKYFNAASLLFRFRLSDPVRIYSGIEMISIPKNNISKVLKVVTIATPQRTKKISAKYSARLLPIFSISRPLNNTSKSVLTKAMALPSNPNVSKKSILCVSI